MSRPLYPWMVTIQKGTLCRVFQVMACNITQAIDIAETEATVLWRCLPMDVVTTLAARTDGHTELPRLDGPGHERIQRHVKERIDV